MEQKQLYDNIDSLPNDMRSEVNDFIDFLMTKKNKATTKKKPQFGCAKGRIYILSPDFDEPLDDY